MVNSKCAVQRGGEAPQGRSHYGERGCLGSARASAEETRAFKLGRAQRRWKALRVVRARWAERRRVVCGS